jgi:hypothetical protein
MGGFIGIHNYSIRLYLNVNHGFRRRGGHLLVKKFYITFLYSRAIEFTFWKRKARFHKSGGMVPLILTPDSEMIDTAKAAAAMGDIKQIQLEIDSYQWRQGAYPEALAQVNPGDRLDPWRRPYIYFQITQGKKPPKQAAPEKIKTLFL